MADLSSKFEYSEKDDCTRFMGDKLIIRIPEHYTMLGYLVIAGVVHVLGIFPMNVDGVDCGLQIPGVIDVDPSDIRTETINDKKYTILELHKGDRIMCTSSVIKDGKLHYAMWKEFIGGGKMPEYLDYDATACLFDDCKKITGKGIDVNHAVIEIVYAHIYRDRDDLTKLYRLTPMTKPPVNIKLNQPAYATNSTHARIIGSYAEQGMNTALIHQNAENVEIEDIFRQ